MGFIETASKFLGGSGSGGSGGTGLLGAISGGIGLVQTGLAVKNLFEGGEDNKNLNRAQQSSQKQSDFLSEIERAIIDPTHPWYQQIFKDEQESGYNAFLSALNREQVMTNRASLLNPARTTSIDPSIRDAYREKQLALFNVSNADTARRNARNVLAAAGGIPGVTDAANTAGQLGISFEGLGKSQQSANIGIIGDSLDAFSKSLPAFEDLFGSSSAPQIRLSGTSGGAGRGAGPGGG